MISFCKNNLHTFLCLSHSKDPRRTESSRNIPASSAGLSLIAGDFIKPTNVLESVTIKPTASKKDSGGFVFLDDTCGGCGLMDGLSSCTESLGFESSDQVEKMDDETSRSKSTVRSRWRKTRERLKRSEEVKKFPPPLSSFNQNGQPSFFLKPVRKDGRLELTEVRIHRPEIFRASRQDGRLRLHFIKPELQSQLEKENEEEEVILPTHDEEEEEEDSAREWKVPLTKGESFRRCHELSNNRNLPIWNHQCVTTR